MTDWQLIRCLQRRVLKLTSFLWVRDRLHWASYATQSKPTGIQKAILSTHIYRLNDLVTTGDGIAILDQGLSLGPGSLGTYGINSNTSANSFLKCIYKKGNMLSADQKLKNIKAGLEEDSDSEEYEP